MCPLKNGRRCLYGNRPGSTLYKISGCHPPVIGNRCTSSPYTSISPLTLFGTFSPNINSEHKSMAETRADGMRAPGKNSPFVIARRPICGSSTREKRETRQRYVAQTVHRCGRICLEEIGGAGLGLRQENLRRFGRLMLRPGLSDVPCRGTAAQGPPDTATGLSRRPPGS